MDPRKLTQIGPYPVRRYVAEGGMAWVFEVLDPRFPKARRALKMLKPDAAHGTELELFHQEAQRLAEVNHPNVITIFDEGRDPTTGCYFYMMSYIEGPSLSQYVDENGPLEPRKACEIIMGALAGLQQIHERNLVHKDIKPSNILVAPPDDRAVVMDLGIAREAPEEDATQHTTVIRGTPLYMSPEQSGGKRVNRASDIFSLGLTLYYCLTRQSVYHDTPGVDASNPQSIRDYIGYLSVSSGELQINLPRRVPRALEAVVRKACRRDPRDRFQDAQAMREALKAAAEARVRSPWPGRLAAAAALAVLAVAGLRFGAEPLADAISWVTGRGTPEAPPAPPPPTPESLARAARERAASARASAEERSLDSERYRQRLAKASRAFAAGEEQLATGAAGAARESFEKASRAFAQLAFLGPAGESEERARALLGTTERRRVDPGRAAVLVAHAEEDFRAGNFEGALATFDQAIEELQQALAGTNTPPELVARRPAESRLEVRANQTVDLAVEAKDPDGDALRYAWTVDGEAQATGEPSLQLASLDGEARVEVRVSDPEGAELKESWQIAVVNARPTLRISPGGDVKLAPGGRERFTARASDPEGGEVTTEFLLDGRKVATGDRYEFEAEREGTFSLLVRATDPQGARVTGKRTITVAALAPEPPAPAPPKPEPAPPTPGPGGRDSLEALVARYEKAFESCNGQKLAREFRLPKQQLNAFQQLCQMGPMHASTRVTGKQGEQGDRGWICFQLHVQVETGGSFIDVKEKGVYQGDAVFRGDGWQFIRVEPGCPGG